MIGTGYQCDLCAAKVIEGSPNDILANGYHNYLPQGWVRVYIYSADMFDYCSIKCAQRALINMPEPEPK